MRARYRLACVSSLGGFLLIVFPLVNVARAALDVQLHELVSVSTQDFGYGLGIPWVVDGVVSNDIVYMNNDDNNVPGRGLYSLTSGRLVDTSGGMLAGASLSSVSIADANGSDILLHGYSNYVLNEPNSYKQALFRLPAGDRVVDTLTSFPGHTQPNKALSPFARISGNQIVHTAYRGSGPSGIAMHDGGSVSWIVQEGDAVPGSQTLTFPEFGFDHRTRPYLDGGAIVFSSDNSATAGVYEWENGSLRTVVNKNTPVPGGGTIGRNIGSHTVVKNGNQYAFATGSFEGALYKIVGNVLTQVASRQTLIPGGEGVFYDFASPTIRDGNVVFVGYRSNIFAPPRQYGIYTDITGQVETIVDFNTDFGGKTPTFFDMSAGRAWVDDSVYFLVAFNDATQSIYRADFQVVDDPDLDADFDGNGFVDAGDLNHPTLGWQARFGNDLDGSSFLAWQRQLGQAAGSTAIAVPEPVSVTLLATAACAMLGMRERALTRTVA